MPAPNTPWSQALVTLGVPLDLLDGSAGTVQVKVTPFVGPSASPVPENQARLIWAATGDPVFITGRNIASDTGGAWQFYLPHVDQPGFIGPNGGPASMWSYQLEIIATVKGHTFKPYYKVVQPLVGQENIDLDLVPDGEAIPGVTAPQPVVSSIAGLTGIIDAESLAGIVGEGVVPDDAEPSLFKMAVTDLAQRIPSVDPETGQLPGVVEGRISDRHVPKGTRRAAFSWGTGGSTSATPTNMKNVGLRKLVRLPVTTTRWRLKVANYDFMRSAAGGEGHRIRAIYTGKHQTNDGVGTGNFTAAPVLAVPDPNAPIPGDGTHYVSPWVSAPGAQFEAGVEHLIAFDFTAAADVPTFRTNLHDFVVYGLGTSDKAVPSPAPANSTTTFLDTYIEYEFIDDGAHPVGLAIGDSITEGQAAGLVTKTWPTQYSGMSGACMVNLGCSGVTTAYFLNLTQKLWSKFDVGAYAPDFAVVTLGTNDANTGMALADFKANLKTIVDNLRSLGVKRIYVGMVPPRTGLTAGGTHDLLRKSYRDWIATLPMGIHGFADFDTVLRDPANQLQMRSDWTADGVHPTPPGYQRMAKEVGTLYVNPR